MDKILDSLKQYALVEVDKPLSTMTTLRIGGNAKYVVYPETIIGIDGIFQIIQENQIPYKVIGKGSDLLCSDDPFEGIVIRFDRFFNHQYFDGNTLVAEAGCSIISLSTQAMKKGLSGLEFASGIPGTVGGCIFMNAGAYKDSMMNVIKEVLVYRNRKFEWISNEECDFSYRHSIFQSHPEWFVLAVRLQLTPKPVQEIADLMDSRRERRVNSQPLNFPSCGSVFKNPEGDNAWRLIDGIGYRGKQLGGAMVSDKHCNFIINVHHATALEYLSLIEEIQKEVKNKYDIELMTEVEKFNWK
ncbi:MAG: UDP-N-acetylmuramate dehydrogenase [Erysipelotrichaceae bacterium]|nr:UDP-N-acetylmuramate dehydrogenase [Erysipelotrichaceae bacterium]